MMSVGLEKLHNLDHCTKAAVDLAYCSSQFESPSQLQLSIKMIKNSMLHLFGSTVGWY